MTKKREIRRAEIRAAEFDGKPGVTLKVISAGVVDDYGTVWMADAFDEAIAVRGPVLCWSHDWSEPLGPMVGFRTGSDGPEIDFVFSDFDAVPMARRAHAQVADGTIRDCSVGFARMEWRDATESDRKQWPGAREVITKSGLDEVSLVLRGAVPGAKVLAFRSATVGVDAAVELARRVTAGELSQDEAKAALALLANDEIDDPGAEHSGDQPPGVAEGEPPAPDPDVEAALAEADAVLADRGALR